MTKQTRYFLGGSAALLVVGLGTGLVAYYGGGFPSFYLNQEYFKENSAFGGDVVHYYLVGIKDPHQATQISKQIDALFENSTNETRTQTEIGRASCRERV